MELQQPQTKKKSKVGLYLAIAALLVNGPRFIIVFLRADAIMLPKELEGSMLGLTGLATGIVLTGGGAYISHRLADSELKGILKTSMIACWLALLFFSVILLAPLMVQSIRTSELEEVIHSNTMQWIWAVTSVLAVEVLASGAMAAYAVDGRKTRRYRRSKNPTLLGILVNAFAERIKTSAQRDTTKNIPAQHTVAVPTLALVDEPSAYIDEVPTETVDSEIETPVMQELENQGEQPISIVPETPRAKNKHEAISRMLEIFEDNPTISYTEVAERVGRDKSTISGYLKELVEKERIVIHDDRVEVVERGIDMTV